MPHPRDLVASLFQIAKEWTPDIFHHAWQRIIANREHWGLGIMLGLTPPASILVGNQKIPGIVSIGTYVCFGVGAITYTLQNRESLRIYGGWTSLILLATSLMLFHGLTSLTSVFRLFPIYTCLTLLTAVNVAPAITEMLVALITTSSYLIELGRSPRTQRNQNLDLEQATSLLPEERPNVGYREPRDMDFDLGFMGPFQEGSQIGIEDSEETPELDASSVSTRTDVRVMLRCISPRPDGALQDMTNSLHDSVEHMVAFPPTPLEDPHDPELGTPSPNAVRNSRIEVPALDTLPG